VDPFKLVDAAIDLVRSGISGNTIVHEHMKRAASTLYYAVFHCLAKSNADVLAGIGGGDAWTKVYRAMNHGEAANRCRDANAMKEFPLEIQQFANIFCTVQEERIQADYNPQFAGRAPGIIILGALAVRTAMLSLNSVAAVDRRKFAIYLLIRSRT
jgi:hypothetical protein